MGLLQSVCETVTVRVWDCYSLSVRLLQSECGTVTVRVWDCYSLSVRLLQSVSCGTVTVCISCYTLLVFCRPLIGVQLNKVILTCQCTIMNEQCSDFGKVVKF